MVATTVAVMGSTGSIGTQTLDVIEKNLENFDVLALGAARSVDQLASQAEKFRPQIVAISDPSLGKKLLKKLPKGVEVIAGPEALADAAISSDVVINGVVGFAGLSVTLATLEAGKRLGLANKESLIAAGPLVQIARSTPGAELIPVDSEHCAIHQCLGSDSVKECVKKIILTASGGPFRGWSREKLLEISIEDALNHPTWKMGPKVTVDSSTLMNKGLEVIEAHELFGIDFDDIEVVVHPQSLVHSMVSFSDGATLAQMSNPDMRLCISYALTFPDRINYSFGEIDWSKNNHLDFEPPDFESFPCLGIAYEAGRKKRTAPAWMNAANEEAVAAFLAGRLEWKGIPEIIQDVLEKWPGDAVENIESVLEADQRARAVAVSLINKRI